MKNYFGEFKGKHVLVTGAAGFIGSHLVRELVRRGAKVIGVVRPTSDCWRLKDIADQVQWIKTELGNFQLETYQNQLQDIEIIYHLAAMSHNHPSLGARSLFQSNVMGTLEMLQLAKILKVERFIYCGSCFEYPSGTNLSEETLPLPLTEYAASKSSAWLLAKSFYQRYQLPVVTLRAFTVYGPFEAGHRIIPYTINQALKGEAIEITQGKQTRDFVFIDDMTEAFLVAALRKNILGQTYNVCTGVDISMKALVPTILKLIDSKSRVLIGARPLRDVELWQLSGNPALAKKELNWSAKFSLEEGLKKTIDWFRERGFAKTD